MYIPAIRQSLVSDKEVVEAYLLNSGKKERIQLKLPGLTSDEKEIITAGCLINHYRNEKK